MNTTYDINGRLWPRADDEKFYSRWSPENQKRFGGLANELPTPQAREVYKHKILGSLHIAASTGQPIDKIYKNFDSVSAQYYGKKITPKEVYEDANNFYHNEYAAYNRPWESIQPVKRGDQNDVIDAVKNTALGYSQPGFAATQGALHMGAVGTDIALENLREFSGMPRKPSAAPEGETDVEALNRLQKEKEAQYNLLMGRDPSQLSATNRPSELTHPGKTAADQKALAEAQMKWDRDQAQDWYETNKQYGIKRPKAYARPPVNNILMAMSDKVGGGYEDLEEWLNIDEDFKRSFRGAWTHGVGNLFGYLTLQAVPLVGKYAIGTALYQEAVDDYKESGGTNDRDAMMYGMLYSSVAYGLEKTPLELIVGPGLKGAMKGGKISMKELVKRTPKRAAVGFGVEAPTETLQEVWLDFIASESYDPETEMFTEEALRKRFITFMISGLVGGTGKTAVGSYQDIRTDRQRGKAFRTAAGQKVFNKQDLQEARDRLSDKYIRKTQDPEIADLFIAALDESVNPQGKGEAQYKYNAKVNPNSQLWEKAPTEKIGSATVVNFNGANYVKYIHKDGSPRVLTIDERGTKGNEMLEQLRRVEQYEGRAGEFLEMATAAEEMPIIVPIKEGYGVALGENNLGEYATKDEAISAALEGAIEEARVSNAGAIRAMISGIEQTQKGRLQVVDQTEMPSQTMATEEQLQEMQRNAPKALKALRNSYRTQNNLDPDTDITLETLANQVIAGRSVKEEFEGTHRYVSYIARDADVMTPIEEIGESYIKQALDRGLVSEEEIIEWYRGWINFDPDMKRYSENREGAIEHFGDVLKSRILTDDGMTRDVGDSKTLQKLVGVKWFDTFVRKLQGYLKEIMAHAQTYIRFREAGLVSDSLEEHLSAVLGYNEAMLAEATNGPAQRVGEDTFQIKKAHEPETPLTKEDIDNEVEDESGTVTEVEIDDDRFSEEEDPVNTFQIKIPKEENTPYIKRSSLKGKKKFAFFADRMKVGVYRGLYPEDGIEIPLRGGPGYPFIEGNKGKAGWAFTNSGPIFTRFKNKVQETDGIGLVALFQPGNVRGNQTFINSYIAEVEAAIKAGRLDEAVFLREVNALRESFVKSKKYKAIYSKFDEEFSSVSDFREALESTTFEVRSSMFFGALTVSKVDGATYAGKLGKQVLVKKGFPSIGAMILQMEDQRFDGAGYGDIVAAVQFDQEQVDPASAKEVGVDAHESYSVVMKGAGIGMFENPINILKVVNIPKEKASPIDWARTSMPSTTFQIKQDADYMAAVESGDMDTAQQMVDEAAAAAGYTIGPVYHGTSPGEWTAFNENPRGIMFTEKEGVARVFGRARTEKAHVLATGSLKGMPEPRIIKAFLKPGNIRDAHQFEFPELNKQGADTTVSDAGVYALKDPSQVKSADPVTYDSDGNVIPLSQRFDESRDDITFQIKQSREAEAAIPDDFDIDPSSEIIAAYEHDVMQETADIHRKDELAALAENRIPLTKERGRISYLMLPVSSSIRQIAPEVFAKLREMDKDLSVEQGEAMLRLQPFKKALKKLTKKDQLKVGLLLSNQEHDRAREIIKDDDAFDDMLELISVIGRAARAAGFDFDFMRDYFPRLVTDRDALYATFGEEVRGPIQDAIYKAEQEKGILSEEEHLAIINSFLESGARGQGLAPGFTKGRSLHTLTEEQYEAAYADPYAALDSYVNRMTGAIAKAQFFGKQTTWEDMEVEIDYTDMKKQLKGDAEIGDFNLEGGKIKVMTKKKVRINMDKSIGNFVTLSKLNSHEQRQLHLDLKAYFNYQLTPEFFQKIRGMSYLTTMGSGISSTMTQLQDTAFAAFEGGVTGVPLTYLAAVFNKSETLIQRELGINDYSQEYRDMISFSSLIDKVFTATGMKHFGRAGQNTLVNNGLKAYQRAARKGRFSARQQERLNEYFANDSKRLAQLKADLANGVMTKDVHLLGWNILQDFHPASLTEMPRGYLENPTARLFYILKTFTIKQFDTYRREGIMEMKRGIQERDLGRFARGFKNLLSLMAMLFLAGLPVDWLKDFVFDRNPAWPDIAVDNAWKLVGLSRYTQYYARQYGPRQALWTAIAPPLPYVDYFFRDVSSFISDDDFSTKDMELWRITPIAGQGYYWWFGAGQERMEKERIEERKKLKSSL